MISFATLGSRIADDCINRNKDFENKLRVVQISPISVLGKKLPEGFSFSPEQLHCDSEYHNKLLCDDLNKNILDNLGKANPDYVVLDFLDFETPYYEIQFDDKFSYKFSCPGWVKKEDITYIAKKAIAAIGKKVVSQKAVYPRAFTDEQITAHVSNLIKILGSIVPFEKILVLNARHSVFAFMANRIKAMGSAAEIIAKNNFLDRVYNAYSQSEYSQKCFSLGDCPDTTVLMANQNEGIADENRFSSEYYDFVNKCLAIATGEEEDKKSQLDAKLETFNQTMHDKVDSVLGNLIADAVQREYGGKQVVVVGDNKFLIDFLKKKYNIIPAEVLPYSTEEEKKNAKNILSKKYKEKSKTYHIVLPKLEAGDDLFYTVRKLGYSRPTVPFCEKYYLDKFKGYFKDHLGNVFDIKNNAYFTVMGAGSRVSLGECVISAEALKVHVNHQNRIKMGKNIRISNRMLIVCWDNSVVEIGDDCTFAEGGEIYAYKDTKIKIGKDCMHAKGVAYLGNSGHSIFDMHTLDNISSDPRKVPEEKRTIEIGNHVWLGRDCVLMGGCKIADGSIVGAKAVVNKKFPNNCSIAGIPAKIIKKDVAWARSIEVFDIDEMYSVPEEYRNFTEE